MPGQHRSAQVLHKNSRISSAWATEFPSLPPFFPFSSWLFGSYLVRSLLNLHVCHQDSSLSLLSSITLCFCTVSRMASLPGTCPALQLNVELMRTAVFLNLLHPTQRRHQMHPLFFFYSMKNTKLAEFSFCLNVLMFMICYLRKQNGCTIRWQIHKCAFG